MGRHKGGKNREWSKEEKFKYVQLILSGEKSLTQIYNEENLSFGMLSNWIKKFNEGGIDALENKTSLEDAKELIKKKTRNYAKRQVTYFKHQLPCEIYSSKEELLEAVKQ